MERLRNWALRLIIVLNVLATIVAFGESYSGLYQWALGHQITGLWAGVWPLMIDVIILVAELGLFVAHHDHWKTGQKVWMWSVMMVALGVSVGGNTGHIHSVDFLTHLTAALPPLALAFALTVGFGVMKRTFLNKPKPVITPAAEMVIGTVSGTGYTRTADKAHVGTSPWAESAAVKAMFGEPVSTESFPLTEMVQVPHTQPETPVAESAPLPLPPEGFDLSETLLGAGLKVTENSFTMPQDPRKGLDLKRQRVRDAYDIDNTISVKRLADALGVAWATAAKYLAETKEARGLELTDKERSYLTSPTSAASS